MLSGRDVSALLLTCKNLHGLYGDEAIWQELCGRHGVFDPTTLGETSFRTLYTELLFAYGGLLGLWASDHPYRGSIIEFRVDTTSRAIVGEVTARKARNRRPYQSEESLEDEWNLFRLSSTLSRR